MQQLKVVVVSITGFLLAGCATTKTQFRNVEGVKTAAIVAMAAGLDVSNRNQGTGSAELGTAQEMANLGSDEKIAERQVQGAKLYEAVAADVSKSLGWSVKSLDEVSNDEALKALYKTKIGTPNKLQLGGMRAYTPGILWTERVTGMKPAERQKLFESLHVDALIFVDFNYYVAATGPVKWKVGKDGVVTISGEIPGTSAAYPATRMTIRVFDATSPEAIWVGSASGDPASIGIVSTKGIEYKTDLVPIITEAASTAWRNLFAAYEADKAKAASAPQK
jgi:hypothetical protein